MGWWELNALYFKVTLDNSFFYYIKKWHLKKLSHKIMKFWINSAYILKWVLNDSSLSWSSSDGLSLNNNLKLMLSCNPFFSKLHSTAASFQVMIIIFSASTYTFFRSAACYAAAELFLSKNSSGLHERCICTPCCLQIL